MGDTKHDEMISIHIKELTASLRIISGFVKDVVCEIFIREIEMLLERYVSKTVKVRVRYAHMKTAHRMHYLCQFLSRISINFNGTMILKPLQIYI